MAEQTKKRGFFLLRPGFLFLCMYIMAYTVLRNNGEIVYSYGRTQQGASVHMVNPNPEMPHWRRQVYRLVFSPIMVSEEESRSLAVRGRKFADQAQAYAQQYGQKYN